MEIERSQFALDTPLFKYQESTVQFVTRKNFQLEHSFDIFIFSTHLGRAVFEIDPGLGKSRIAIECFLRLQSSIKGPILILCSKKALNTWRRELPKWTTTTSKDFVIIEGSPAKRRSLWKLKRKFKIITFDSGMRDIYIDYTKFEMVIVDECKIFRNRKTKKYQFWSRILKKNKFVILMDGTLVAKGPQDLWGCLHILRPSVVPSYWKFVNTFCLVVDGFFGKEIVGPKNTEGLGKFLSTTMIRLKDDDPEVSAARPPLVRDTVPIDMNTQQSKIYKQLVDDMMALTENGRLVVASTTLALTVRLRQLLICPKLLDPKLSYGTAIEHAIAELEDDPHQIFFTPYAKAIPFIKEAIIAAGYPEPYSLQGGTNSLVVGQVEKDFNTATNFDRAIIISIKFAESYELWTARQCRMIGYEWSQVENIQAEKRMHRLITPHSVNAHYYRYVNTVDDDILEVLNTNARNTKITYQDYFNAIKSRSK